MSSCAVPLCWRAAAATCYPLAVRPAAKRRAQNKNSARDANFGALHHPYIASSVSCTRHRAHLQTLALIGISTQAPLGIPAVELCDVVHEDRACYVGVVQSTEVRVPVLNFLFRARRLAAGRTAKR